MRFVLTILLLAVLSPVSGATNAVVVATNAAPAAAAAIIILIAAFISCLLR